MTHPFHPLFGREIEIVTLRHNWKECRIYYHNSRGRLDSISLNWTSCYAPDPAVEISGGRSPFLTTDLLALASLIRTFREEARK